ncbi:hypothetical protein ACFX2F_030192 [Malus domestica]
MGLYPSILTQCSMYKQIKTRKDKRRRLLDSNYGSTIKKQNPSLKRARNSFESSVAAHDVSKKKVRVDTNKLCRKNNVSKPIHSINPHFDEPMLTMLEKPKKKNTYCDCASEIVDKHSLVQQKRVISDEGENYEIDVVREIFELKKTPVGPYFEDDDLNRLENFMNSDYSRTLLWKSDQAIVDAKYISIQIKPSFYQL